MIEIHLLVPWVWEREESERARENAYYFFDLRLNLLLRDGHFLKGTLEIILVLTEMGRDGGGGIDKSKNYNSIF